MVQGSMGLGFHGLGFRVALLTVGACMSASAKMISGPGLARLEPSSKDALGNRWESPRRAARQLWLRGVRASKQRTKQATHASFAEYLAILKEIIACRPAVEILGLKSPSPTTPNTKIPRPERPRP